MRRILILRGGALGDFLVTLPAIAVLRERWPDAEIDLVGNAVAAALGVQAGLLTRVESQHGQLWSELYNAAPLSEDLEARLAAYDLVLSYWPDPDGDLRRRFPLHPHQRFLSDPAHPLVAPAAAHYCAPLMALGLKTDRFLYPLAAPAGRPTGIALHPGSGSTRKNWPLEHWSTLARWLRAEWSHELFVISGECEPAGLLSDSGQPWRSLPLNELLNRLASCRLFIGHDSGISHLAAAAGAPCVLLFGPTDPRIWAPPGPRIAVVQHEPAMESITLGQVQAAVKAALGDQR
ncbi:MAG: glycosyltransferase family 9 protein [Opitutaceae bacterium]|nr:glycosyltransferase family 9 protein [Opitutaceae bacterium]